MDRSHSNNNNTNCSFCRKEYPLYPLDSSLKFKRIFPNDTITGYICIGCMSPYLTRLNMYHEHTSEDMLIGFGFDDKYWKILKY